MIVVTDGTRLCSRASRTVVFRVLPFLPTIVYAGFPSRVYQCPLSLL